MSEAGKGGGGSESEGGREGLKRQELVRQGKNECMIVKE